jgi:hypothetical protein
VVKDALFGWMDECRFFRRKGTGQGNRGIGIIGVMVKEGVCVKSDGILD